LISYNNATLSAKDWGKAWHLWALFNTEVMSRYTLRGRPDIAGKYVVAAVTGYFYSIACASTTKGVDDSLQVNLLLFDFCSAKFVLGKRFFSDSSLATLEKFLSHLLTLDWQEAILIYFNSLLGLSLLSLFNTPSDSKYLTVDFSSQRVTIHLSKINCEYMKIVIMLKLPFMIK
jgi:hypothetical protein